MGIHNARKDLPWPSTPDRVAENIRAVHERETEKAEVDELKDHIAALENNIELLEKSLSESDETIRMMVKEMEDAVIEEDQKDDVPPVTAETIERDLEAFERDVSKGKEGKDAIDEKGQEDNKGYEGPVREEEGGGGVLPVEEQGDDNGSGPGVGEEEDLDEDFDEEDFPEEVYEEEGE